MTQSYTTERRSERKRLDVTVRIQQRDGHHTDGRCVDASDEGFGIVADMRLEIGELVKLRIGRSDAAPWFVARVVWQEGPRTGLFCVAAG